MSETIHDEEEQARQIIRDWLTVQNRSLRNLAHEADIQPSVLSRFLKGETALEVSSALKIYSVLQRSMSPLDRKRYIDVTGLLPLASAFSRDALFTVELQAPGYEVGSCFFASGIALYYRASHEDAIPLFREAEKLLGEGASLAAFAGCMVAQIYVNLGDLQRAQEEAIRVHTTYGAVMDPETRAELYRIRNWIDYYLGHYAEAERWQWERISIGKEGQIERLQNPHFLGRIYYDLGCHCRSKQEAEKFFSQAAAYYGQSYQINVRWGTENNLAFDLFRQAQVLQMQQNGHEAQRLRSRARQMFTDGSIGGALALLHIELEEAKLLAQEGEIPVSRRRAEEVLNGWAQVKYAKGVGDSLKVLGELAYMQGHVQRAFEIFVARLCVYPYDTHPANCQVWEEIKNLQDEIVRQSGRVGYQEALRRVDEQAQYRQGYFAYLNQIVPDRSHDVMRVLTKLQSCSPLAE